METRLTHEEASKLTELSGREIRQLCREGRFATPTAGLALGYQQANLVVLPKAYAFDFLLFCQRNPKPCPLLEVTEPGVFLTQDVAKLADLRTDLPRYRVYHEGTLAEEITDATDHWRSDFVAYLLGCSFTFESALLRAGLPVRHLEETLGPGAKNVPMYRTNIPCRPAGLFRGPLVVSMRPMTPQQAILATNMTQRFTHAHGAPVHFGDPKLLGIQDLDQPDWGDPVTIHRNEIPVFWACGVTPQAVAMESAPEIMITHAPGHMFVCDRRDDEFIE